MPSNYQYNFSTSFNEINIPVDNTTQLNSLLFKVQGNSKGVILYFHGNAGALHQWGERAELYTQLGYDIWFVDYRGYGKNKSEISNEDQFLNDALAVYSFVTTHYPENKVSVLGFSIGSGLAAKVASLNQPKQLILEAPYYSFERLIKEITPYIPSFLVQYKIPTHSFLASVTCPITLIHGKEDYLISSSHSIELEKIKPEQTQVFLLDACSHNGIYTHEQYLSILSETLN